MGNEFINILPSLASLVEKGKHINTRNYLILRGLWESVNVIQFPPPLLSYWYLPVLGFMQCMRVGKVKGEEGEGQGRFLAIVRESVIYT